MKSRRDFLKTGIFTCALASLPTFFVKNSQASENEIVRQTHFAMGTIVTYTISQTPHDLAYEAIAKAHAEMVRLEKIFSRHDTASALSILNAQGRLTDVPHELSHVLLRSIEIARNTSEVYNPTVKPLLDLFEAHQNPAQTATHIAESEIAHARELVQLSDLKLSNNTIELTRQGMGITLDSIAKGYIIDQVSAMLTSMSVQNHVINAGGDVLAKGRKSADTQWTVGIENPENTAQVLTSFAMENQALATSGSYQKYYDAQATRHHIIDPLLGQSPQMLTVSCKADSAMNADAYATVCALLPQSSYSTYRV